MISKIRIFIFFLSLISFNNLYSQSQWNESNGTYSGVFTSIINDGNTFFAASEKGISYSTDNGTNWSQINNGLSNVNVKSISKLGSNFFAGTNGGGVFYSNDNGNNWVQRNTGLPSNVIVYAVAISGNRVYIGTHLNGMYWSDNNGLSWSKLIAFPIPVSSTVRYIKANGTNVYAIVDGVSLVQSNDFGLTWQYFTYNNMMSLAAVTSVSITPNKFYISTINGAYEYIGGNLNLISSGNISNIVANDNLILVVKSNGLYKSTNNGLNWSLLNTNINYSENQYISSIFMNDTAIMCGTNYSRICLSNDIGVTWKVVNTNIYDSTSYNNFQSRAVSDILYKDSKLYAATSGGVYVSEDFGNSWSIKNNISISKFIFSNNDIYSISFSGDILHSNNNFESFTNLHPNYGYSVYNGAIGKLGSTIVCSGYYGVRVSHDNGVTWTQNNLGGTEVSTISVCGSKIYASGWLSSDNGNTWVNVNNPPNSIASYSDGTNLIFERYSNNCGSSINNFTNYPNSTITSITMYESTIFVGTSNKGVFYSNNFGNSWNAWNDGLPTAVSSTSYDMIRALYIANGKLYISYNLRGVWSRSIASFLSTDEFVNDSDALLVYPNPTNSKITIDCSNSTNLVGSQIKITNFLGQEIYHSTLNEQVKEVLLNSIATKGMYFVSVIDNREKAIIIKKIILE